MATEQINIFNIDQANKYDESTIYWRVKNSRCMGEKVEVGHSFDFKANDYWTTEALQKKSKEEFTAEDAREMFAKKLGYNNWENLEKDAKKQGINLNATKFDPEYHKKRRRERLMNSLNLARELFISAHEHLNLTQLELENAQRAYNDRVKDIEEIEQELKELEDEEI